MTEIAEVLFVVPPRGPGTIWTGTASPTEAVAVANGRIIALGQDAMDRRGSHTDVVELGGRSLLPGFRDGHLHPLAGGAESLECDLVDAADVDEVLARLRAFAATAPNAPWVLGYGYPPELLPDGVGRSSTLDTVVGDKPVALWSSDHHMVWCNSRALAIAGVTAATPDPPRGAIVRTPDGAPVGTLLEEAERLLEDHVPPRGRDREIRGLQVGLERMARAGLVWGLDAKTYPETLPAYLRVADAGGLTADLDLAFKVEVEHWRDQVAAFEDARREAQASAHRRAAHDVPGGRLTATTVKFFVDGVIEGGTGALLDPYCAFGGTGEGAVTGSGASEPVRDHGIVNWEPEELLRAAVAMDSAGFQLHLHAIGDAAIRMALDTFDAVEKQVGPRDRRPVVAHTHLVHPEDLPRFAASGAIANLEPLWAQPNEIMRDLTEPRLGPKRSRWQYPIGSLLRSGARVSFGSDWPVSSLVPLDGIAVAVTRRGTSGPGASGTLLPEEAISLDQAIAAYTAGTAYQAGDEHRAGRIAVGHRADLVLTEHDITVIPPDELPEVEVTGTWLAGVRVHGR